MTNFKQVSKTIIIIVNVKIFVFYVLFSYEKKRHFFAVTFRATDQRTIYIYNSGYYWTLVNEINIYHANKIRYTAVSQ